MIGLGRMGLPMATRLLDAGFAVRGFDVAATAGEALTARGGRSSASPGDAVRDARIVILMLPDSDIVDSVTTSPDFESSLADGGLVVDMGSSNPIRTRALHARLQKRGLRLVDAPVSGGVVGAETGKLAIMAGGAESDLAALDGVLSVLGSVTHVGPVGSGHALKALNNLLSASTMLATSEAMRVGAAFGLDPETMLEVINRSSGRSWSSEFKWPRYVLTDRFDSGFALGLMVKDMRIAVGLGESLDTSTPFAHQALELWLLAAAELPPTADHTDIARWVPHIE